VEASTVIAVIATALELMGLFLLAREVYRGQETEKHEHNLAWVRRSQFLFAVGDFRAFWIARQLDEGILPDQAQQRVGLMNDAQIKSAVLAEWSGIAPQVARSLTRWEARTVDAVMLRRRRALVFGSALLGIAAILHLFE
jgi:hypothetical protein